MKPIILAFVHYYLPGFRAGGPIRTIANMVDRLGDEFEFRIVTADRDIGDEQPYPNIELDTWIPFGKAFVRYVSTANLDLQEVVNIARSTPHDVIYLNSLFDPRFTLSVLVNQRLGRLNGRPIVLAPRGEFSKGALALKNYKKKIFLYLAKFFKLYDGLTWQASSLMEVDDITSVLPVGKIKGIKGSVHICGNITVAPDLTPCGNETELEDYKWPRDSERVLRICFLSRISPMKNLDFALTVLAKVSAPLKFFIYGPIEDQLYWERCMRQIEVLPPNIQVVYKGPVENSEVVSVLATNDLFLLPTRGENFGHVIHEALRAGLVLLISDKTPWNNLCEKGIGWDLPLENIDSFVNKIEEVAKFSDLERKAFSKRARIVANEVGGNVENIKANRNLFINLLK